MARRSTRNTNRNSNKSSDKKDEKYIYKVEWDGSQWVRRKVKKE